MRGNVHAALYTRCSHKSSARGNNVYVYVYVYVYGHGQHALGQHRRSNETRNPCLADQGHQVVGDRHPEQVRGEGYVQQLRDVFLRLLWLQCYYH